MASLLSWAGWNQINNALVLRPAIVCTLHLQWLFVKIDYIVIVIIVKAVVGRSSLVLPNGCRARTLGRK
jgi:hypothetical protein